MKQEATCVPALLPQNAFFRHTNRMNGALKRPGDVFLDRYFKDADEETRERAREAFREFARVLEGLGQAVARMEARDSRDWDAHDKIEPITDL